MTIVVLIIITFIYRNFLQMSDPNPGEDVQTSERVGKDGAEDKEQFRRTPPEDAEPGRAAEDTILGTR